MMKIQKYVVLYIMLTVFIYSSICYSANWAYVAKTSTNIVYVNIDSIQKIGDKVNFLEKFVNNDGSYTEILILLEYKQKIFDMLNIVEYDKNGNKTNSATFREGARQQPITPGTANEAIYYYVLNEMSKK